MRSKSKWVKQKVTVAALYNIYGSTDPDLPKDQWTKMNKEPLVDTKNTLKGLEPGVRYYFYMTAFYPGGPESPPSNVSSAVPKGKPREAVSPSAETAAESDKPDEESVNPDEP
jgi:hypothetical protein